MARLRFGGSDGLVAYLADRLTARGHTVGEPAEAFVRVVDPTREAYEEHVAEVTAEAARMRAISIITRHGEKLLARYKRAVKAANIARAVTIATGEVRDPSTTGMNPIDPELHAQLFPGLDPEVVVFATELALGHTDRVFDAAALSPWLRAGVGPIRAPVAAMTADPRRARAALVDAGFACALVGTLRPAQLIGDELAGRLGLDARPLDYELGGDFDLDQDTAAWAGAINLALDAVVDEPRRVWQLDRGHVAFTSANEWAIAQR